MNFMRFFTLIFGVSSSLNYAIGLWWIIIRGLSSILYFFDVSISGLSLVCFFSMIV